MLFLDQVKPRHLLLDELAECGWLLRVRLKALKQLLFEIGYS